MSEIQTRCTKCLVELDHWPARCRSCGSTLVIVLAHPNLRPAVR